MDVITFNTKTGKYHLFQGKRFIGAYDTMLQAGRAALSRPCKPDCHCANCRPDLFVGSDLEAK
jgi:hypothetical protein